MSQNETIHFRANDSLMSALDSMPNKSSFIREAVEEKLSRPFDPKIVEKALRGAIRDVANPKESDPKMTALVYNPIKGYEILAVYETSNVFYPLSLYGKTWEAEEKEGVR